MLAGRAFLDGLGATHAAAALDAGVDHHAGGGRLDLRLGELIDVLGELLLLEVELALAGAERRLVVDDLRGGLELRAIEAALRLAQVGLELRALARSVVVHEQLLGAARLVEADLRALEVELVTIELALRQEALLGQLLRPVVGVLRLGQLALGELDLLLGGREQLSVVAVRRLVLLLVDAREGELALRGFDVGAVLALLDVELRLGLLVGRLGVLHRDLLRHLLVDEVGGVQFDQQVARLDLRALGHEPQDRRLAFDLALDAVRVLRREVAALDHRHLERAAPHLGAAQDALGLVAAPREPQARAGDDRQHESDPHPLAAHPELPCRGRPASEAGGSRSTMPSSSTTSRSMSR
jgi:hypothetical protein